MSQILGTQPRLPPSKQALNIVERPIPKNRAEVPTVSLSAFAYLFSELIQYTLDRSNSTVELEDRCAFRFSAAFCQPFITRCLFLAITMPLRCSQPSRLSCAIKRVSCSEWS